MLLFLWRCDPTRAMASSNLWFLYHTRRRITVGRTPLDEWSASRRDLYLTTHNTHNKHSCPRLDWNPRSQQASGRRPTLRPQGHRNRRSDAYQTMMMMMMMMNQLKQDSPMGRTLLAFSVQNFVKFCIRKVCVYVFVCTYMYIHTNTWTNVQFKRPNSLRIKWKGSKKEFPIHCAMWYRSCVKWYILTTTCISQGHFLYKIQIWSDQIGSDQILTLASPHNYCLRSAITFFPRVIRPTQHVTSTFQLDCAVSIFFFYRNKYTIFLGQTFRKNGQDN